MSIIVKSALRALIVESGNRDRSERAGSSDPLRPHCRACCPPAAGRRCSIRPTPSSLLDHQAGLFQTVKDIGVAELRANIMMLAKLATLLKIPVITTASEPNGPNGPLMPEIHQFAPHAVYVPRKGEVNAWDNEDFVKRCAPPARRR